MVFTVFVTSPPWPSILSICKDVASACDFDLINQEDYMLSEEQRPSVILSDGSMRKNSTSLKSIDFDKFNADILMARYRSKFLIVSGFCMPDYKMKIVPDAHIHLSYIGSEIKTDIAWHKEDVCNAMFFSMKQPDYADLNLIKEIILPFYIQIVEESTYTHILPLIIHGKHTHKDLVVARIQDICYYIKRMS